MNPTGQEKGFWAFWGGVVNVNWVNKGWIHVAHVNTKSIYGLKFMWHNSFKH
jgi:hypothetical protein